MSSGVQPPQAVYLQVVDDLRDRLTRGDPSPGQLLPSEGQLAERYGVSRATINRAVTELRREGLVEVQRGVGTVVCGAGDAVRRQVSFPRPVWAAVETAAKAAGTSPEQWLVDVCRDAARNAEGPFS